MAPGIQVCPQLNAQRQGFKGAGKDKGKGSKNGIKGGKAGEGALAELLMVSHHLPQVTDHLPQVSDHEPSVAQH